MEINSSNALSAETGFTTTKTCRIAILASLSSTRLALAARMTSVQTVWRPITSSTLSVNVSLAQTALIFASGALLNLAKSVETGTASSLTCAGKMFSEY